MPLYYERVTMSNGDYAMHLNLGSEFRHDREKMERFTFFEINTYTKVLRDGEAPSINSEGISLSSAFRLTNEWFAVLNHRDSEAIAKFLVASNARIKEYLANRNVLVTTKLLDAIERDLDELDKEIDLLHKLTVFCAANVPIPDMSDVGNRAQDSDLLTFRYDDIIALMGIVALAKFLTPVFGEIMNALQKLQADNKKKEILTAVITGRLLDRKCKDLVTKLNRYISHDVKKSFEESKTTIHHGITTNSLCLHIYSSLIVRNYVNLDPYRRNSQLMTFTSVAIRRAAESQSQGVNHRKVMPRVDKAADDDSKKSNLEIDSLVSRRTGDVPVIVAVGLNKIISDICHNYDIGMTEFNTVLNHNLATGVAVHNINRRVIFNILGPYLGGAKSISTLTFQDMAKAITLVQLMCFSMGYHELGHAITAKVGNIVISHRSADDTALITDSDKSEEFRIIRNRMEDSRDTPKATVKQFAIMVKELAENAVTYAYIYNTCEVLWQATRTENLNDRRIQFTPALMRGICAMLRSTMERA
jgi:hypothetical protein